MKKNIQSTIAIVLGVFGSLIAIVAIALAFSGDAQERNAQSESDGTGCNDTPVPCGAAFERGVVKPRRTTVKYAIVDIEGMPCIVLIDRHGHISMERSMTCDWSKWEGE